MSKIYSSLKSVEIKLISGIEKKPFNKDEPFEHISIMAKQDVSIQISETENSTFERIVQVKLTNLYLEDVLLGVVKHIRKQIDITTHE